MIWNLEIRQQPASPNISTGTVGLGYTVTYAVGNTLLIIWGVVIVLLI